MTNIMRNRIRHPVWAILAAGLWINLSEFARNEWLLANVWQAHYRARGLTFVTQPVNGVVWMIWGFALAALIAWLARQLSPRATVAVVWALAFVLMWLVLWNLQVLPTGILPYAVPWSLLETAGAVWICVRLGARPQDW